jgi:hypothetical protein
MSRSLFAPEPVKVYHEDLKARGIVRSRYDQHEKIKAGKLRPPNKDGNNQQSSAWWWWVDIIEDLERERAMQIRAAEAKQAAPQRCGAETGSRGAAVEAGAGADAHEEPVAADLPGVGPPTS